MITYLEEKIEWYDENYRIGRPLISDKKFDQLEKNLLRIDPKCDYFNKKNKLLLPSLPKDEYKRFLEGLLPNTKLSLIKLFSSVYSSATNVRDSDSDL